MLQPLCNVVRYMTLPYGLTNFYPKFGKAGIDAEALMLQDSRKKGG